MPLICYLKMEVLKAFSSVFCCFFFLSAANLTVSGACTHGKIAPTYLKEL